jgi:hypothetical protein
MSAIFVFICWLYRFKNDETHNHFATTSLNNNTGLQTDGVKRAIFVGFFDILGANTRCLLGGSRNKVGKAR